MSKRSLTYLMPKLCAVCSKTDIFNTMDITKVHTSSSIFSTRTTTIKLKVPLCRRCYYEYQRLKSVRRRVLFIFASIGSAITIAVTSRPDFSIFAAIATGSILGLVCGSIFNWLLVDDIGMIVEWDGRIIRFKNPEFARAFLYLNPNVSW